MRDFVGHFGHLPCPAGGMPGMGGEFGGVFWFIWGEVIIER